MDASYWTQNALGTMTPAPIRPRTIMGALYPPVTPIAFLNSPTTSHHHSRVRDPDVDKENRAPFPSPPPPTTITPTPADPPKQKRASPRSWETKLSDAIVAIKANGFDNVPHFLQKLFDPTAQYTKSQNVSKTISTFLGSNKVGAGRTPRDIVDAWYRHPDAQPEAPSDSQYHTFSNLHSFSLPSGRPEHNPHPQPKTLRAHDALSMWATDAVLETIDLEAESLAHEPTFKTPSKWDWNLLASFSMDSLKEKLISLAPVTWSVFTTISVSHRRRGYAHQSQEVPEEETLQPETVNDDVPSDQQPDDDNWDDFFANMSHNPWDGAAVLLLFLVFMRSHFVSFLPNIVGLSLFMTRTNKLVYQVLGRFGVTTAYSTALNRLNALSAAADETLHRLGQQAAEKKAFFVIVFDNINKHHRAWSQTVANMDEVRSGTAATLVAMEDVPDGAFDAKPYHDKVAENLRRNLTLQTLVDDIDHEHLAAVGAATLLRIWTTHIPSLQKYQSHVNKLFREDLAQHRIPRRKATTYPLRTSGIDESTTAGNSDVLKDITQSQLRMTDDDFKDLLIPVAGDQLTIDRGRKLKVYTWRDCTPYACHSWLLPVIQLWHMRWAFLKALFKAHWALETGKNLHGLRRDCEAIRRTKLNPIKCDFYSHESALMDTFEALCLQMLRVLLRELSPTHPTISAELSASHLLDSLDKVFSRKGSLSAVTFSSLETLAKKGYLRYMCTSAYEDALGQVPRDPAIYASHTPTTSPSPLSKLDNEVPLWDGDRLHANLILRLRDCLWYYEMRHATSFGDIGRIRKIIPVLCFVFWGSGSTNYGNELLEMACNFHFEYPPALQTAILNSWLINPTGRIGGFHELDLEQEHNNGTLKGMFDTNDLAFDSTFLQNVSLNLNGFHRIREFLGSFFGIKMNPGDHTSARKTADFNTLGAHYERNSIFTYNPCRYQAWIALDWLRLGYRKLAEGQLAVFIDRTSKDCSSVQIEDDVVTGE